LLLSSRLRMAGDKILPPLVWKEENRRSDNAFHDLEDDIRLCLFLQLFFQ
jgi:hypothetical protein